MRTDLLVDIHYVPKPWRSQRADIAAANAAFIMRPVPLYVRLWRRVRLMLWRRFSLPCYQTRVHGVERSRLLALWLALWAMCLDINQPSE